MSVKQIIHRLKQLFCLSSKNDKLLGTIKFFDRKKRFGFIISGKQEYFFHAVATNRRDFKLLQDGVAVRFKIVQGKKGPQADHIEIV